MGPALHEIVKLRNDSLEPGLPLFEIRCAAHQ